MTSIGVWLDPFTQHFEHDRLFRPYEGAPYGDDYAAPWRYLRDRLARHGIAVHTADLLELGHLPPASLNLYVSLGIRSRFRRLHARRADIVPSAFFAFECPVVEPRLYRDLPEMARSFRRMFSFSSSAALQPYVGSRLDLERFHLPQSYDRVHAPVWANRVRSFLVMINANKVPRNGLGELYRERLEALAFFQRHDEIDLFGFGWDGPAFRIGETWVPSVGRRLGHRLRGAAQRLTGPNDPLMVAARQAYRGPADAKAETLGRYTFAVCFENMVLEGWVTEKLFDCLLAGTVPIYLGAPDIERWVPQDCYVDMREFSSYRELRAFLHDLSSRDIEAYREAGRAYIESDRFRPFSKYAFADRFTELVTADAGIEAAAGVVPG
jgi:alpha(1,3/1,4) fucosyltransferase